MPVGGINKGQAVEDERVRLTTWEPEGAESGSHAISS